MEQMTFFRQEVKQQLECSETWLASPSFPAYEVSSLGRFRKIVNGRILIQNKDINGYRIVQPIKDGRQYCKTAHRLICEAFHGPPPSTDSMTNHIDGDKSNNQASNLEWVSRSQNSKHYWQTGRGKAAIAKRSSMGIGKESFLNR